jgi:pimeloyl-ACP methyl ester carboxylesterase
MRTQHLEHAWVNGTEVAYQIRGTGLPVVLLHCGFVADSFAPLLDQAVLTERYRVISYYRRGYAASRPPTGPMTMADFAADCRALLAYLRVDRAHVVRHSFGGNIALQLALDAPELVRSLALLEPPLPGVPLDDEATAYFLGAVTTAMQRYAAGDTAGAVDAWLRGAFQPQYRTVLDRVLPGWFAQAVADADAVFQVEVPALQQWTFSREDAARIRQPVLSVLHNDPLWSGFRRVHEQLIALLPQTETYVVPNATHLLPIMNPQAIASRLANFFARHTW